MGTAHQTHDYGLIENVANEVRRCLFRYLEPLHCKSGEIHQSVLGKISDYERQAEADRAKVCSQLDHWSDQLVQVIQEEAESARVEVQIITEAKLACLVMQKTQLTGISDETRHLISLVKESAGTDVEFLTSHGTLESDIHSLLKHASTLPLHPLEGPGTEVHMRVWSLFLKPFAISVV